MILRPSAHTLLPALLLLSLGVHASAPSAPDLLLIVVESLRADQVHANAAGYARFTQLLVGQLKATGYLR